MNDTQKKILLRLASWAVKRQEARGIPSEQLAADRAAFVIRYELEHALDALTQEGLRDLKEGLDTLKIGKAHS